MTVNGNNGRRDPLELMTITEVAGVLKLHRGTVRKKIEAGELYAVQLGRHWRVPRAELERYLRDVGVTS